MAAVNVNQVERGASLLLGGVLLIFGLRHRSPVGAVLALAAGELLYRGISGHCHLYQTFDLSSADGTRLQKAGAAADAMQVERSITIGKSADELYRIWREPGNLSRSMRHFAEVTTVSENRMHWLVRGPLGQSREWDVRVVKDRPGELLRWESVEGAELPNEGTMHFRPAPSDWGHGGHPPPLLPSTGRHNRRRGSEAPVRGAQLAGQQDTSALQEPRGNWGDPDD